MKPAHSNAPRELYELVYDELLVIAKGWLARTYIKEHSRESCIHESFTRLVGNTRGHPAIEDEQHLQRLMARAMGFVCKDWHREANALKRGGGRSRVYLESKEIAELSGREVFVFDYLAMYDEVDSFAEIHPELAPIVSGWLLWECPVGELAQMYAVSTKDARTALLMFLRHYKRHETLTQ